MLTSYFQVFDEVKHSDFRTRGRDTKTVLSLKDGGGSIDIDEVINLVIGLFSMCGIEVV